MSIANLKGGFNVTLRVEQTSSNESLCVLERPILKKAENWSLQITDMLVNKTPVINRSLGEQLRIIPYEVPLHNGFRSDDYIFTPKKCYTVCEYVVQLQRFFNKFSFLFFRYGVTGVKGATAAQQDNFIDIEDRYTTGVNFTRQNNVPDVVAILAEEEPFHEDEGYAQYPAICSCLLTSNLKLIIKLEPLFLVNFYIKLADHFVTRLGFPKDIYRILYIAELQEHPGEDTQVVIQPDEDPVIIYDVLGNEIPTSIFIPSPNVDAGELIPQVDGRYIQGEHTQWVSDFTVRELDDRLSMDLVSTFPASRKINILDGTEKHEFLLARFDLSNYKNFDSVTTQDESSMSSSIKIVETYNAGLENLTRQNPDHDSNLLLSGSIQQVHLMLYTRYLEHNKIKRVKTDMEDGYWHTRMLFSKKT